MQRSEPGSSIPRDRRRPRPAGLRSPLRIRALAAVLFAAVVLAGCGQEQARRVDARQGPAETAHGASTDRSAAAEAPGLPHLLAFACGEAAPYLAVYDPASDTAVLYTMDGAHALDHHPAASGAKYADARHVLWTKGQDDVMLEIDGERLDGCEPSGRQRVLTEAYQAGFVLRASGNEPFWTLFAGPQAIRVDRLNRADIRFPGLSDDERDAFGLAEGGVVEREAGAHRLRVTVTRDHCLDTMSGEPSPLTVIIALDDETLHGCGLWLAGRGER